MKTNVLLIAGLLCLLGGVSGCKSQGVSFGEETATEETVLNSTEALTDTGRTDVAESSEPESTKGEREAAAGDGGDIAETAALAPENAAETMTETMSDEDFYSAAAGRSRSEVEQFAKQVRQQFLDHDWSALSEKILYPITIGGVTYGDGDAFLASDPERGLNPEFLSALEAESCEHMFCNWQGIMMGAEGQVWIAEELNEDLSSEGLKIRAINGLTQSQAE